MNSDKRGFTLIELLIAISIIGLLSSVVLTTINTSRIKARNTQRIANANAIEAGFYVATTGTSNQFPITNSGYCLGKASCWNGTYVNSSAIDALLKTGMAGEVIPLDPSWKANQYGDAFVYYADASASFIYWVMENEPGNTDEPCGKGLATMLSANGLGDYICELDFYYNY